MRYIDKDMVNCIFYFFFCIFIKKKSMSHAWSSACLKGHWFMGKKRRPSPSRHSRWIEWHDMLAKPVFLFLLPLFFLDCGRHIVSFFFLSRVFTDFVNFLIFRGRGQSDKENEYIYWYIYIYIYICIHVYTHVYVYIHTHAHILYIHMYMYTYIYTHMYMCVYTCIY
jgi:hypothetical protein